MPTESLNKERILFKAVSKSIQEATTEVIDKMEKESKVIKK